MNDEINLGDEVKDVVTGFKGVVTGMAQFIYGCERVDVQPKVSKDGTLPEPQCFDIKQVKLVKKKNQPKVNQDKGGPRLMPTRRKMIRR